MTVTKVGLVYSRNQRVRRRLIVLDHEGAHDKHFEPHKAAMLPGEEWIDVPLGLYKKMSGRDVDDWLASKIGPPESDDCLLVAHENDVVIAKVKADPRIDAHPDGFLIQDEAEHGQVYEFQP